LSERIFIVTFEGVRGRDAKDEIQDYIMNHMEPGVFHVVQNGRFCLNVTRVGSHKDAKAKAKNGRSKGEYMITVVG
jgi:hypothetical protein